MKLPGDVDSMYEVEPGDWPVGNPMDLDSIGQILGQFEKYHPLAVISLAETVVPPPETTNQ
ncbi:MAG TPA: hypothetical protein VLF43_01805 [Candidatus Saccharimonadales bacterium]|nr:hypothetical protein [Candidatus Saccharimonadales bacterium]